MRHYTHYEADDYRVIAREKAIKLAGGLTPVAKYFGVTPQAIYKWEVIPATRCIQMETLLEGRMTRYEMRPDVFGYGEAHDRTSSWATRMGSPSYR